MTSMRRNDVTSTSFHRHVPNRFLINQCQIITFLILKYDIIENSRIELRGIVLPVRVDALLGGPKGMLAPLSNHWGGLAPLAPPLPTPMTLLSAIHCWQLLHYRRQSERQTDRQAVRETVIEIKKLSSGCKN